MGASTFMVTVKGENAEKAFTKAVREARARHGNRGYTGTIAEKGTFTKINLPKNKDPEEYARQLIKQDDKRIMDKWGPASCIIIEEPNIKDINKINVENYTKKGRKKWETVYKIQFYLNRRTKKMKDTKTEAIKAAKRMAKRNGEKYVVIVDKKLVSHDKLEAEIEPVKPNNKLGKYLFFGLAPE